MWQPIVLPYKSLPWISERTIHEHYGLYLKYLERWDTVSHALETERDDTRRFSSLQSEEGSLRNAVRLHELYFENLTPGAKGDGALLFGGMKEFDRWLEDFRMLALTSTGWVVLAHDLWRGDLFNVTMKDHGQGFPLGAWPLLVLDCYEHAYMIDYGTDRDDYFEAFMGNVDWTVVQARAEEAVERACT